MSEYWVSKKKYWCQYCEIYIADDAPSRSQHENGLRHKGNKERFVRSLYKAGVKKKQELEQEKREMRIVDEAAQAAFARDIGAGLVHSASSSSAAPVPSSKPRLPPPKPSDPYVNYTTAASLGITDTPCDTQISHNEGRVGDWVAVVPPPPPLPPRAGESNEVAEQDTLEESSRAGDVRKRPHEDIDDNRRFTIRRRTAAVGLGAIYDPGVIRITPRVEQDTNEGDKKEESSADPGVNLITPRIGQELDGGDIKAESIAPELPSAPTESGSCEVKKEESAGSLFRKRRAPVVSRNGRREA